MSRLTADVRRPGLQWPNVHPPGRIALFLFVSLVLGGASGFVSAAEDAGWMSQEVPGYVVRLSVKNDTPATQVGHARHTGDLPHLLRVKVETKGDKGWTALSSLLVDVAEAGYAGETITVPTVSQEAGAYQLHAALRPGTKYRFLVRFMARDDSRTREALFEYRHHH